MNKKSLIVSKNSIKLFSVLFLFIFIFSFSVSSLDLVSKDIVLNDKVSYTLDKDIRIYSKDNSFIKTKDLTSSISYDDAIIKKNYVSVKSYDNPLDKKDAYEISHYTGDHEVMYNVYKHSDYNIDEKIAVYEGELIGRYFSDNGYVNYSVSSFSTYVLTTDNDLCLKTPNYNYSIDLTQFYDFSDGPTGYESYFGSCPYRMQVRHEGFGTTILEYVCLDGLDNYLTLGQTDNSSLIEVSTYNTSILITTGDSSYGVDGTGTENDTDLKLYHLDSGTWTSGTSSLVYSISNIAIDSSCPLPQNVSTYNHTTGLLSHYELDDNAASSVVTDSHGTEHGVSSPNTNNMYISGGKIGGAFDFTRSGSEYFELNRSADLGDNFSISFWMKPEVVNVLQVPFEQGNPDSNSTPSRIRVQLNNQQLTGRIYDGGWEDVDATTSINAGTWYYVVLTYDGTTLELYVNGESEDTAIYTNAVLPIGDITIGSSNAEGSIGNYFDGVIDEVSIYENYVLNSTLITDRYNSGNGIEYPFSIGGGGGPTYAFAHNMSNVNLLFNDYEDFDSSYYFNITSEYTGACYLNYTDPINNNSYQLEQGTDSFQGASLNTEKFEVYMNTWCDIELESYEENYTTELSWGVCDDSSENCYWTTFDLIISDTTSNGSLPSEDVSFGCTQIDNCSFVSGDIYLYGDISESLNQWYSGYTYVVMETDSYPFNATRFGDISYFEYSGYNVSLDPTMTSGDIYLNYSSTWSNVSSYNNMSICNAFGCIYQEFYYVDSLTDTISYQNSTLENLYLAYNDYEDFYFYNYYNNLSYVNLSWVYNNVSYAISTPAYCGMGPCQPNETILTDYFRIGITYENLFYVYSYDNDLELTINFLSNGADSLYQYSSSFDINISSTGLISPDQDYAKLKNLFPEIESESTSKWFAFFVIIALLVVGIIFVGLPLRFSGFALFIIGVLGLVGAFVMAWVGYSPWSWFIVPPILFIVFFIIKLMAGSD